MHTEPVAMMTTPRPVNDKNQVQVIARAASILRALENEPLGLSRGNLSTVSATRTFITSISTR